MSFNQPIFSDFHLSPTKFLKVKKSCTQTSFAVSDRSIPVIDLQGGNNNTVRYTEVTYNINRTDILFSPCTYPSIAKQTNQKSIAAFRSAMQIITRKY